MVGIRSVGVGMGEYHSEDSFVCIGTKPTKALRARFPTWPEEDKKRQGTRAVNR